MTDSSIFENKIAAYYTLGCKLNFAETSTIGKELAQHGIRKARAGEAADICVINTCSVTELADRKCRQLIRRIHRLHPKAFIVATGCYAQLDPEAVSRIDGVDLVLGNVQKAHIMQYLNRTDASTVVTSPARDMRAFAPSCSAGDRTRHFLKVQDGCDYCCTYCTIPFARGRSRNGSIGEMVAQAAQVAREGGKEIVLTGVNIGDFGKSTGETFAGLLRALDGVDGIERYRISSVEPNLITDEIIAFVAQSRRFAPHFHIPLQSGCDETLRLMRRRYDTALFRRRVEKIKELMPDAFIGADVIVGTRGETEACFEASHAFVEQLPVSQLHVFHYSERPGTQALKIEPAVPPDVRHLRSKRLLELSALKWKRFCDAQYGRAAEALFEHTRRGNRMYGFTANYVRVEAAYAADAVNRLTRVRLGGWNGDGTALACTFAEEG
ncbi:MAG: tRNA (N(6)-L-threonylcarbamoyladenosine(37)-C(2))-methylthiotransferase MtaB [Tannerella sp.]|jgi:threonylcarbamoyladenosine tRNA methylthiotransferase MtaB|nr:tRNA (N(6)-L-threonylcarbamoyladenosine(37)-C(2))-methylthiotransferase MtaB [Tannerella sp.]